MALAENGRDLLGIITSILEITRTWGKSNSSLESTRLFTREMGLLVSVLP
jgi:hypothetical protein